MIRSEWLSWCTAQVWVLVLFWVHGCGAESGGAVVGEASDACGGLRTTSARISTRCSNLGLSAESDPSAPDFGQVDCRAFAYLGYEPACPCDGGGFSPVSEEQAQSIAEDGMAPTCAELEAGWSPCVCELEQLQMPLLEFCHQEVPEGAPPGWCYINPPAGFGAATLTEQCPVAQQERLRIIGTPRPGQTRGAYEVFFYCTRSSDVPMLEIVEE